jgi:uncharacterized spore protein YtfJ
MTQTATHNEKAVLDTISEVVDHASASKVFGSPISQDGITVLPVAKVNGGGGGGGGSGQQEAGPESSGSGGGFGVSAKPLGVFVIKQGRVGWRPAIDVNKVIIGGQIVLVVALLTLRAIVKARSK